MVYYNPLKPLQSAVLETLAEFPDLTIEDLHSRLRNVYALEVSIQNLYRLVASLIEHQVLVRTDAKLSLHRVWVQHLISFGHTLGKTYTGVGSIELGLPENDEDVKVYTAGALIDLDSIWNDGLLRLAQLDKEEPWYVFNSHPWYSIGMPDTEYRLYKSIVAARGICHMVYGNDTYLDRYGKDYLQVDGFHTYIRRIPEFNASAQALWVCGDYIVECMIPTELSKHFDFFFRSVEQIEHFDPALFTNIFRMKAKCRIKFLQNKDLAGRFRSILKAAVESQSSI